MEMKFLRYEAFMKTFGKTNSMQATSQTGEDNLDVIKYFFKELLKS